MSRFTWNPRTFADVAQQVDLARSAIGRVGATLAIVLPGAIHHFRHFSGQDGLPCPAPTSDATGRYRVGLDDGGKPEIQRLTPSGAWEQAPDDHS